MHPGPHFRGSSQTPPLLTGRRRRLYGAARAVETAGGDFTLAVVESALRAAEGRLADLGRGLPDPDAEDGVEDGADGLRKFSPSAFAEALGGAGD